VADSHGAALVSGLDATRLTHTVRKGQDHRIEMYSAFRDMYTSPCVAKSALEETLVAAGVRTVYCVGLAGDYCVKSTALHARESGFATAVVEDGTRSIDQTAEGVADLKRELAAAGIELILSDELMK
jgi:nicotinamidase-related amidase